MILGGVLLGPPTGLGVPAEPGPYPVTQPGGARFAVVNRGDEWRNWVETVEGYTVAPDAAGRWYYVQGFSGEGPILTDTPAHEPPPSGLERHIRPPSSRPAGDGM